MKNLIRALIFIGLTGITVMAQTQATATVQVTGNIPDGKILVIGDPDAPITFEFGRVDPENGNFWVYNHSDVAYPSVGETLAHIAFSLSQALKAADIFCTEHFDGIDTITLTVDKPGARGNDFILLTDESSLVLTGFTGGED